MDNFLIRPKRVDGSEGKQKGAAYHVSVHWERYACSVRTGLSSPFPASISMHVHCPSHPHPESYLLLILNPTHSVLHFL